MLIENYNLGGHVYNTGIYRGPLDQLKISKITAAVFNLE